MRAVEIGGHRRAPLPEQRRTADRDARVPSTVASTPRPVIDRKSRRRGHGAALTRRGHDRPGERVLAVGLHGGGEREQLGVGQPGVAGDRDVGDDVLPSVSVPVLSNSTALISRIRSSASRSFTRMPARAATAVESAITSGIARPSACGHAITSTVTVCSTASSASPTSIHTTNVTIAGAGGHVEQQRRGAVGQRLRARARRLRFGDEPLDAGERGVVADRLDAHADGGVGRDRPGDDAVADVLRHRPRLAGDHRLVELGLAVDDHAVGGHARARAHEHDVARAQRRERHRLDAPSSVDALGLVGQQLGERGERALGLADGLHLEPVAEQHDHDEERELPPEVEVEVADAEAGGEAGDERHRDRERDQQHHPRLAGADLADAAAQERPAAVEEDDRAEDGRDPGGAGGAACSRSGRRTSR